MTDHSSHQESRERANLELVGHSDIGGCGDGMQAMVHGDFLYVGHLGPHGLSILDVADPAQPQVVGLVKAPDGASSPKVQIADGLLLTNAEQRGSAVPERTGLGIYDLIDPARPTQIGVFETKGVGVHRIWYSGGRYAYLSAEIEGFLGRIFLVVDVSEPDSPTEVGRWWWQGQWTDGGEVPTWSSDLSIELHHGIVLDDISYTGLWDGGLVLLDVSDPREPTVLSHLSWAPENGGATHTALPLQNRNLVVVTDEAVRDNCEEPPKRIRVFHLNDGEPQLLALAPEPQGNFCERGLWFGPHNLHENSPGTYYSEEIIFATYANAGVRVYDLRNPEKPVEVGYYIPVAAAGQVVCQSNDIVVDTRHLIYVTDRVGGGVSILRPTGDLAHLMAR